MWMEFWVWSVVCSGAATSASTLFLGCVCLAQGLSDAENFGKLFLSFLWHRSTVLAGVSPAKTSRDLRPIPLPLQVFLVTTL